MTATAYAEDDVERKKIESIVIAIVVHCNDEEDSTASKTVIMTESSYA
jgi:hypothetical protein